MSSSDKDIKEPLLDKEANNPSQASNQQPNAITKKPEEQYPPVSFFKLYRFATKKEKMLLTIAFTLSITLGGAFPIFSLIFGNTVNDFSPDKYPDLTKLIGKASIQIIAIGVGVMVLFFTVLSIIKYVGQRQGTRLKSIYLQAIMRQEMGFFDKINPAELSSRVEDDCKTIIEGTEDKVVMFIFAVFTFLGGFIVAFYRGWQLTLCLIALTPLQALAGAIFGKFVAKSVDNNAAAYAKAGAIAEQALSSIRTVIGLAGEDKEAERYTNELSNTKKTMIKYGFIQGICIGIFSMTGYLFYAVAFYFGSIFVENHVWNAGSQRDYTGGDVVSVYFAVVTGGMSLLMTAPSMKAFYSAKQTAARVFALIDRKSNIDPDDESGKVLEGFEPKIEFKDVIFSYPSNPDKVVLNNINFEIPAGKTIAIVGESGSGKSTIVQLIERLYDPNSGTIEFGGHDLKTINLKWLRKNISYVGQEPVLFTGTIRENLSLARENVTEDEMIEALKKANAHDFVMKLEKKLDTFVGVGGIQLSGGQKQRVAIARAILRNTQILLLDEATSALDRKNEKTIQATLDKISVGFTTIIIAHRLSTVRNADKIIVLNNGIVEEIGTHSELVSKQGLYYKLQLGQLNGEDLQKEEVQSEKTENNENSESNENEDDTEETEKINNGDVENEVHRKSIKPESNQIDISTQSNQEVKSGQEVSKKTQPKKINPKQALVRLFTFSKPERPRFFLSLIFSIIIGAISPIMSILISNVLFVLLNPTRPDFEQQANMYSLAFLILAFLAFFLYTLQFWNFAVLSESLTNRLRTLVFKKYLRMQMAWHDHADNSAGILTSALATDTSNVSALTSTVIGLVLQGFSALATGITIAFVTCWQIAVVSLLIIPVFMILGGLQKIVTGRVRELVKQTKQTGQIISEVINNVRTVACLGREKEFRMKYETILQSIDKKMFRLAGLQGIIMGANQTLVFVYFGVTFYVGAWATENKGFDPKNLFMALFAIINAVSAVSGSLRYLPDVAKANDSANLLFKHIDMESEIDIDNPKQSYKDKIRGFIEFRNVAFKYPSRENDVFEGLNFKVEAGQKVALVGSSGCGKSTIVQLLLRFYDVKEGEILIDGVNIKEFDLRHLRRSFGYVSQEPVLFNGSIEYNIKYN